MNQRTLRIPGTLKHKGEQSDASLKETAREHIERHPGLLFLTDVLRAVHASPEPLRGPAAFFDAFPPREVMDAFGERPDLRVRALKAMTGGPTALLRRLSAEAVATQIDLLAADDLPEAERSVRAEADRARSVHELYLQYVDPVDVATYLPAGTVWEYEAGGAWWSREATAGARSLMATELRSVRHHALLTDSEILDVLGDETFERYMPLTVRTALRSASRRAAAAGKPFTDSDLFAGAAGEKGGRDLVDELVANIPLPALRVVVDQVARILGLSAHEALTGPTKLPAAAPALAERVQGLAAPATADRIGPKPAATAGGLPPASAGKPAPAPAPTAKARPPAPPPARTAASKMEALAASLDATEVDGPPQPDDELAFIEEVPDRV
ncbi:MAG TPA: hypothetical protein VMT47_07475 [Polyangia bacterium]|nr:hypothetical protein [Polyangia bacterium]